MANLKDIRKRCTSVRNTQKITSAMKLVSTAYFGKALQAVQNARPYGSGFNQMISSLLASDMGNIESPYTEQKKEKKVLLIIAGTDKGLCGGLNSNNHKFAEAWLKGKKTARVGVELITWGRKPTAFAKKLDNTLVGQEEAILEKLSYEKAKALSHGLMERYKKDSYDAVYLIYPRFITVIEQVPTLLQLLPVKADKPESVALETQQPDFIVEPKLVEMIDALLERKICGDVYRLLLNAAASEYGARMSAMDSATNNASEVIKKLTIQYNRARQATITTELIEIISGAEALN